MAGDIHSPGHTGVAPDKSGNGMIVAGNAAIGNRGVADTAVAVRTGPCSGTVKATALEGFRTGAGVVSAGRTVPGTTGRVFGGTAVAVVAGAAVVTAEVRVTGDVVFPALAARVPAGRPRWGELVFLDGFL